MSTPHAIGDPVSVALESGCSARRPSWGEGRSLAGRWVSVTLTAERLVRTVNSPLSF